MNSLTNLLYARHESSETDMRWGVFAATKILISGCDGRERPLEYPSLLPLSPSSPTLDFPYPSFHVTDHTIHSLTSPLPRYSPTLHVILFSSLHYPLVTSHHHSYLFPLPLSPPHPATLIQIFFFHYPSHSFSPILSPFPSTLL